jgi:hypothetical protein
VGAKKKGGTQIVIAADEVTLTALYDDNMCGGKGVARIDAVLGLQFARQARECLRKSPATGRFSYSDDCDDEILICREERDSQFRKSTLSPGRRHCDGFPARIPPSGDPPVSNSTMWIVLHRPSSVLGRRRQCSAGLLQGTVRRQSACG